MSRFRLWLIAFVTVIPLVGFTQPANPDSLRAVADSLHAVGDSLSKAGRYTEAITPYEQEIELRKQLGDTAGWCAALNRDAEAYCRRGKYELGMDFAKEALKLGLEAFGEEDTIVAWSWNDIGVIYKNLGNYKLALENFEKALMIKLKALGSEHPNVAVSYHNIGVIYDDLGDYQRALENYEKALAIKLKAFGPEHPYVATSYYHIGIVYAELADYERALENHEKALAIWLKILGPEHPHVALSYTCIGMVYDDLGDYQRALENHEKALEINLNTFGPEHPSVVSSYNNIGIVYYNLGDYQRALENYEKDLAISLKAFGPEHPDVAISYNNIGVVYEDLGEYQLALEYHEKALGIRLKVLGPEHPDVAKSYGNIGVVYDDLGDYQRALENYEKALGIWLKVLGPDHPDVAISYGNIGVVYEDLGEYQLALEYHEKALGIRLKVLGPEHPDVAASYNGIGNVYRSQGELDSALLYYKKSIEIFETTRGKIESEELRKSYTETVTDRYEAIISLLIEMDRPEEAFEYLERSKSKALKDELDEKYDIDFGKGTMREKIKESKRLGMKADALEGQLIEEKQKPDSLQNELKIENLSKLLAETKEEYNRIAVQIQADPDYAFAVKVEPVQLGTMREDIPSGQKLLMTYAGENELYLFLLSQEGYVIRSVSISRDSLNNLITECYRLCGSRNAKRLYNEGKLMGWSWIDDGSDFYNEEVAPLKGMLNELYTYLIEPLEEELSSAEVVTIIPSGNLYYVPWGALLDAEGDSLIFLSERYNWNILTSTELWKCIQRREGKRKRLRSLVLVVNPAGSDPPLEYAEGEVTSIEQFYPNSTILTGIEATEPQVISVTPQGQALHLATHCNLDTESPWESYIQLACTDSTDGKWTMSEVSGQSWGKMQLVTLSACQTALGGGRPGLEFISMATAFSLAIEGPPSIVATLWKVHDESTKELMVTFYEGLKSNPKSEALRKAQQKLIHSDKYAHPFFWAPFILIGEWR